MIPERFVTIPAPDGPTLEGGLSVAPGSPLGIIVCHPHPRYGGDMDSHVVVAVAAACQRLGLATLRFNFRGVGGSGGAWDDGRGEQADVRAAISYLRQQLAPPGGVALAGYSFGAAMAALVASSGELLAGLALVAPPLAAPSWRAPGRLGAIGPILVVAGDRDDYCPREGLAELERTLPDARVVVIPHADHFFGGASAPLADAIGGWARILGS
jgi:uncharacterized protein